MEFNTVSATLELMAYNSIQNEDMYVCDGAFTLWLNRFQLLLTDRSIYCHCKPITIANVNFVFILDQNNRCNLLLRDRF